MNKDYYKPYEGRDIKILDQHAANTIAEDHLTFPYQLLDHLAHVLMLKEQGIISQEDAAQILGAVLKLRREGPDIVPHKPGLTDLYSNVEEWVIAQVGIQVGGKMHTGRSRNDMNPAIERMYIRRKLLEQMEAITFLMETLLVQAEVHKNTIIPAYTHHSQQAQPITLGHFYMSAFENFGRDMERLMRAYEHVTPAASSCRSGRMTALCSMDATSTLDYAYEPACAMAIFINNVGRVTESLLLWNLNEVGISRLALPYCSYSTIMPQKRNPVALETLRYSGEWTYGTLSSMFNTMKAYPPGNGREPGLVVGQFFEIMQRITDSAFLLEGIIRNLEVDVPRALEVVRNGFSTVTDLADEMVRSMGLSFSAAKKIVGRLVVIAHDEGIACTKIDTALVARAAKEVLDIDLNMPQELITNALDPVQNVTRRHIIGGPSPERVQETIDNGQAQVEQLKVWRLAEESRLQSVEDTLVSMAEDVVRA